MRDAIKWIKKQLEEKERKREALKLMINAD